MDVSIIVSIVLMGLASAMLLFLIASGLTLTFGILGIVNFAHGSLYMLGAYIMYSILLILNPMLGSFWLGLIIAVVAVGVLGFVVERFLLHYIYKAEVIYQLLLTFALVMIIEGVVKSFWGLDPKSFAEPSYLDGSVAVLGRPFPIYAIFIIIAGFVLSLALWALIYKTNFGKFIRAANADRDMTNALGVNVNFIFTAVFTLGAALASLGGVLSGPIRTTAPDMGSMIIIDCFAIVVIGGLGSLPGAFIGSLLIGLLDAFGTYYVPRFSMAFTYILMAVVLIIRPAGLFGTREH